MHAAELDNWMGLNSTLSLKTKGLCSDLICMCQCFLIQFIAPAPRILGVLCFPLYFWVLLFKEASFWGPTSVVLFPFSVRQEPAKAYLLLQDRPGSGGTICWPPPPRPSSGIMIKTKPQLFIRAVWELFFPENIWKLSVLVPSTLLLPIITSIGMSWFKPYGV